MLWLLFQCLPFPFLPPSGQLEDPATLKKERDEVRAAAAAIARQKLSNKIDKRKKELGKWVKSSKNPQDLFKSSTLESVRKRVNVIRCEIEEKIE